MHTNDTQHEPVGRYKSVTKKKSSGATYTPPLLATFVAKQILSESKLLNKKDSIRILDPAVGDGELLIALIQELKSQGHQNIEAFGFDTNSSAIETSKSRIEALYPDVALSLSVKDFLQSLASEQAINLSLFDETKRVPDETFDLIIANPPYVRTQILGASQAAALADKFNLEGRVDLYYAFLLGLSRVLHKDSVVGIIVSNRFMTTKAGTSVRRGLLEKFSIFGIWDFGDTRLFDAAVLPAVLVFGPNPKKLVSTRETSFTSIYTTQLANSAAQTVSLFESLDKPGRISTPTGTFEVRIGNLHFGNDPSSVWRIDDAASNEWLSKVTKHTHCTFRDVGKIRVGIKTTADNVFIRSDWSTQYPNEKPELLQPLITHHIARRFKAEANGTSQVLYPHVVENGRRKAVSIDQFPKSKTYLKKHRSQLEGRKYVIEAGRKWYEIWVPQDPAAWSRPKVVFRDISEKPTFWMDLDGSIVNGDCYWMYAEDEKQDQLLWLILAVANSKFIEAFYDHKFNNKLYAGRRRFMTQYVEQFPLPDPSTPESQTLIKKVKKVYKLLPKEDVSRLEAEIDSLVWKSFGFQLEEISG